MIRIGRTISPRMNPTTKTATLPMQAAYLGAFPSLLPLLAPLYQVARNHTSGALAHDCYDRLTSPGGSGVKFDEVETIGVLGGGIMGGGIAQIFAIAGYPVVVRD